MILSLLHIYLVGCFLSLIDLSIQTYNRTNKEVNIFICILVVLSEQRTIKYVLKSWYYFLR